MFGRSLVKTVRQFLSEAMREGIVVFLWFLTAHCALGRPEAVWAHCARYRKTVVADQSESVETAGVEDGFVMTRSKDRGAR